MSTRAVRCYLHAFYIRNTHGKYRDTNKFLLSATTEQPVVDCELDISKCMCSRTQLNFKEIRDVAHTIHNRTHDLAEDAMKSGDVCVFAKPLAEIRGKLPITYYGRAIVIMSEGRIRHMERDLNKGYVQKAYHESTSHLRYLIDEQALILCDEWYTKRPKKPFE